LVRLGIAVVLISAIKFFVKGLKAFFVILFGLSSPVPEDFIGRECTLSAFKSTPIGCARLYASPLKGDCVLSFGALTLLDVLFQPRGTFVWDVLGAFVLGDKIGLAVVKLFFKSEPDTSSAVIDLH